MITKLFLMILLFISAIGKSQIKQLTIIDSTTEEPIEGVHLLYAAAEEGAYTNAEGVVRLVGNTELLIITHLNYEQVMLTPKELKSSSTIRLNRVDIALDEVFINSFDLKKAMQYVLDNYYNLYVDYATEKECSFKETLLVDGKIHRLMLSELKWWTKSSAFTGKNLDKITKLKLGTISHNKNVPVAFDSNDKGEFNPEASGHIVTKSLLASLYLNIAVTDFLKNTGMLEETVEKSSEDIVIVSYTTDWKNANNRANRTRGKVVFDKKTKAIIEFQKNIEFQNNIQKTTSSFSNKGYQSENKRQSLKYYFTKKLDGKFRLSRFSVDADVILNFEDKTHQAKFKNDLYILKETKKKRVTNDGLIDLEQAIYKSFPSKTLNSNTIVLTAEEKAFLDTIE